MLRNKGGFSGKCLMFVFLILIGSFLILNFFGFFSITNLSIIIKQTEPIRKPLALLFIGIVLLAFVIVCLIVKKNHKR